MALCSRRRWSDGVVPVIHIREGLDTERCDPVTRLSVKIDVTGGSVELRLRRRLAAALVFAALAASGCTEDRVRPSDTLPPLPSSSASTTPTPTEDAPGATGYPLPEEARAYTPEGARAFFDYFIAVLNASPTPA